MKTVTSYSLLLALLLFAHCAKSPADPALYFLQDASLHFYFSHPEPDADSVEKEKARNALVNALDAARATVRVWCYEMDEPAVIDALVRAKARGVSMDIKGSPDVGYGEAEARGLVIARRPKSGLAHAKVVIIDQSKVFSGSGNLTTSDFFWNNNAFFLLNVGDSEADQIRVALDNEETTIPPILPFQGRMLVSPGDGRLIQMRIV
ncbi:MAG: hypothetical protein HY042_08250, partial [Spirochaetia bacterium]|nr:hypothetical protein [Spirochaetia bacterium]